ncbi:MAG: hypothetical protein N2Z63_09100, partial [Thiobacillaceae bacterium]|nr:hypothetical protein [Thiobacillaceae bacterium]
MSAPALRSVLALVLGLTCIAEGAANEALSAQEAGQWLQRVADSARRLTYEGKFVFQQGDVLQTMYVVSRASGGQKHTQLVTLDGTPRELLCREGETLIVTHEGGAPRVERRPGSRHFPDLLPANAAVLVNWYSVRWGENDRVAGLDCRWLELAPRDVYRWRHELCVEKDSLLPLKAVMVNEAGRPLQQYAFTEVTIGTGVRPAAPQRSLPAVEPPPLRASTADMLTLRQLPPGYT